MPSTKDTKELKHRIDRMRAYYESRLSALNARNPYLEGVCAGLVAASALIDNYEATADEFSDASTFDEALACFLDSTRRY